MKNLYIIILIFFSLNATAQRNVILIIADDLGTDYCGFYENHVDTAPMQNIRRLLDKGIRFTNATSNPVCSPTRAGILTGRYSFRTGVGDAMSGMTSASIDTSEKSIPELLKEYNPLIKTANVGKWHLNQQNPASNLQIPNLMGYDYYAGNFLGGLNSYTNWTKVTNGVMDTSTNYATTETTDDAINWVKAQNSDPFFLWLAYNAPHTPLHLPPAGLHSYSSLTGTMMDINSHPKEYFKAMLETLDHEIGRLFDSLIVYNKMDSTDVIFIGDNGNGILASQIADTTRSKGTIYQYGVHVPFIISGPSVVNPNRITDALVNTQDLFATILELFGNLSWQSQIPLAIAIDSKSILPVINDQSSSIRDWAFTEIFKVVSDSSEGKAMRNLEYKLLDFEYGHQEFYNLSIDTMETNDLLTGTLSFTDLANYNYLCSEMTTLVGTGTFCNTTIEVSDFETIKESINVYPNPFSFQTTITFNKEQINTTVKIFDLYGKELRSICFSGKHLMIDKGNLVNGIYFVEMVDLDGNVVFRNFIVQ
jgi:arylsulfatase A-like enzyme